MVAATAKAKKPAMRVIALASSKGGPGKSTLAAALAVRAAADGAKVALIDTDPQISLKQWHEMRGSPNNPKMVGLDASGEALELLMAQRWHYVFIDTPPALFDHIEQAIAVSDFVLIPTRPSPLDILAVRDVVELCKHHHKPFAFVINQTLDGASKLTRDTRQVLAVEGHVLNTEIASRKQYALAIYQGKSAAELKDGAAAAAEIDALWSEIKAATA